MVNMQQVKLNLSISVRDEKREAVKNVDLKTIPKNEDMELHHVEEHKRHRLCFRTQVAYYIIVRQ